jgi:hypothetical protein
MSILVTAAAAGVAWWVLSRMLWPKKPCPAMLCRRGQNIGSNARRWGNDCHRCGGNGWVPRWGARPVRRWIGRPL